MSELSARSAIAASAAAADQQDAANALATEYLRRHPDEVARFLDGRSVGDTSSLIAIAPAPIAAAILEQLNPRVAAEALGGLELEQARSLITAMSPSRAAPIVVSMPENQRDALLMRLDPGIAKEIREQLSFPAESAGALMDPRISAFSEDMTVDDALRKMRTFKEKRDINFIYVQDSGGRLVGAAPLGEIATATPETKLRDLIRGNTPMVHATAPREEIVEFLNTNRLQTLPVVDAESRLVGVIRYRELVDAAESQATMSLQTLVGAGKDEKALSPIPFSVKQRLPWLEINLATAFLAAAVVGLFEDTIARFTALAVLLPVVAGQSGNAGMQALGVTVRGLALREIRVSAWPRLIFKEAGVGILNGIAISITTMLGVFLWSHSIGLVLVIGIAMILAMVIACICGAMVPLVLKALGQDPATSSSIVLTTFTDCGGFLSFLGLATLLSSLLPQ